MTTVTVSSKYQVVIPRDLREALHIRPGERLHALRYRGHIALVPVKAMKTVRGFLKGIATDVARDADRS